MSPAFAIATARQAAPLDMTKRCRVRCRSGQRLRWGEPHYSNHYKRILQDTSDSCETTTGSSFRRQVRQADEVVPI